MFGEIKKAAVLGSGAWGTAIAHLLYQGGHEVVLWSAFEKEAEVLRDSRKNPLLPGLELAEDIIVTTHKHKAAEAELVVLAVPSFAIEDTANAFRDIISYDAVVCNAAKGICEKTGRLFSELISEKLPGRAVVALSGPSLAGEVAEGIPTAVVAASKNRTAALAVQKALSGEVFRVYINSDETGVQLGGAVKNVIALCAGISDGLGMGDNTKAALMTRGLAETARLGVAMGAEAATFSGLSGIGDLAVTCMSMRSRNHRAGILIGKGLPAAEAVAQVGTVEGYYAVQTVCDLAEKYGVEMPITEKCRSVCYGGEDPRRAITELMSRPFKAEDLGN